MLEQSLAAIEKTEPEKIVIEEGRGGIQKRVPVSQSQELRRAA